MSISKSSNMPYFGKEKEFVPFCFVYCVDLSRVSARCHIDYNIYITQSDWFTQSDDVNTAS